MATENIDQNQPQINKPEKVYLTPRQLPAHYPAFSESSIRYLIFHGETNGFNSCIKRIGRKILVERESFERWIDQHKA